MPTETTEVTVETTTEDGETLRESFVPASRSLLDMIRALPASAFEADPSTVVPDLTETIRTAGSAIEEKQYETAIELLTEARGTLDGALRAAYEPAPNEPDAEEVERRLSERIEWVRTRLEEANTRTPTPTSTPSPESTPSGVQNENSDDSIPLWMPVLGGIGGLGGLLAGFRYLKSDDSQNDEYARGNVYYENGSPPTESKTGRPGNRQANQSDSQGGHRQQSNRPGERDGQTGQSRRSRQHGEGNYEPGTERRYENSGWTETETDRRQGNRRDGVNDNRHRNTDRNESEPRYGRENTRDSSDDNRHDTREE